MLANFFFRYRACFFVRFALFFSSFAHFVMYLLQASRKLLDDGLFLSSCALPKTLFCVGLFLRTSESALFVGISSY